MIGSAALITYLREQRWFGAKGGAPSDARVAGVIALPWSEGAFAIALVDVDVDSTTRRYQIPVTATSLASETGPLVPAESDPRFLRALADALATGADVANDRGTRWIVEPLGEQRLSFPPTAPIRVSEAEQSNTSIVFDQSAILKLYRRLESGVHPDVELTRFLTTDGRFAHTPVLLATLWIDEPASGGGETTRTVAGVVQEYVAGSRDGWSVALERGRAAFVSGADETAGRAFLSEAARLGAVTREMHQSLATATGSDLVPEPADRNHVEEWARHAKRRATEALEMLGRPQVVSSFNATRRAEAKALASRSAHYLNWIDEIVDTVGDDAGLRIRTHGDYHLGQALVTPSDDFVVIDFEGEPARSLAARRAKGSALRDVAGMLRSFGYAAAVLRGESVPGGGAEIARLELASARWERDLREAFLSAYLTEPSAAAPILPKSGESVRRLLALFEAEKAFYELTYELNHRPSWAWVPMRGISKLLVG